MTQRSRELMGKLVGVLLIVVLLAGIHSAMAETSFSFLFSRESVRNDDQLFLNLTVSNSGYSQAVLEPALPRIAHVEVDLPVILFLARESGQPIDFIVDLRAQGLAWSVIFARLQVPPDTLFVGFGQDPGPPYGKAWGYWRKNPRAVQLSDGDISGLVQVQFGSRWAGVSPNELARARGRGESVAAFVAEKQGRPYGAGKSARAKGAGKGKEKGRGGRR